jgi:HPt (histidine-containing phosphotransfer) domain-containing protein
MHEPRHGSKSCRDERKRHTDMSETHDGIWPHPLVDPSVVAGLSAFKLPAEPDPAAEVTRLFFELTPERLAGLSRAAASGDAPTLRDLAHLVKGSASTVGAIAMETIAEQIEGIATIGTLAGAVRLVDALAALFARTKSILDELVPTL